MPHDKTELVPKGRCRCGKSNADCAAEWDKRLGITGHTSDGPNRSSEYHRNLRAIAQAKVDGEDPYHNQLNSRAGRKRGRTPVQP